MKESLHRMRIAVWALTFGVAVSLIAIALLIYGNPQLV